MHFALFQVVQRFGRGFGLHLSCNSFGRLTRGIQEFWNERINSPEILTVVPQACSYFQLVIFGLSSDSRMDKVEGACRSQGISAPATIRGDPMGTEGLTGQHSSARTDHSWWFFADDLVRSQVF